jgi:hypothetical protein
MRPQIRSVLRILRRQRLLVMLSTVGVPSLLLIMLFPVFAGAGLSGTPTGAADPPPSLTITPGVIMVQAQPGKALHKT